MNEPRALLRIAVVLCAVYTAAFASVAYEHIHFPGFTEAMEGDVLQHVERAAHGKPIYPPATAEYIPLAYFPGYYYAAAPFYLLLGDDLRGPRLASFLASLTAALAVRRIVVIESRSQSAGLIAIALFFAGYRIKDENLATALPDALLLMWLMLGWSMLAGERTWKKELAALLFFLAAFWTKQQGAILASWGVLYCLLAHRSGLRTNANDWRAPAAALLLYAATTALFLSGLHPFGERMFHFTFGLPSGWERTYVGSAERMVLVCFLFVPFAGLASACYAFRDGFRWSVLRQPLVFAVATTAVTCLYTVAATGSSNNHYIPFFTLLEATAVLGVWRIAKSGPPRWLLPAAIAAAIGGCIVAVGADRVNEGHHPLPLFVAPVSLVVAISAWMVQRLNLARLSGPLLLVGQLAASFYLPWDYWPPRGWQPVLTDFQEELRRLDFDVTWPDYGSIPFSFAGGTVRHAPSWVVLEDVARTRHSDPEDMKPFRRRMAERPPKWLVTAGPLQDIPVWQEYAKSYVLESDYGSRFEALRQLDRHWYGSKIFPRFLYRHAANR
jgi:hypothetical protein